MATRSQDLEATFTAWVDAREPELQRTAHLLTGDLAAARGHVQSVLASLLTTAPPDEADLDPLALRTLVAEVLAAHTPTQDRYVEDGVDPRQSLVWDFLGTLSPGPRTALVLRLHRRLDDGEIAALVGGTRDSVADGVAAALDDLAGLLQVPAVEAEAEATSALAARAEGTPNVSTSLETVRAVARRRRSRRTRGGLLLATAALVVVAVPVAALTGGGLPTPAPSPAEPTPADAPDYGPEDRVPPPWVLPPGQGEVTIRVDLETRCSSVSEEEFRSTTTIRAGCRTFVITPR